MVSLSIKDSLDTRACDAGLTASIRAGVPPIVVIGVVEPAEPIAQADPVERTTSTTIVRAGGISAGDVAVRIVAVLSRNGFECEVKHGEAARGAQHLLRLHCWCMVWWMFCLVRWSGECSMDDEWEVSLLGEVTAMSPRELERERERERELFAPKEH